MKWLDLSLGSAPENLALDEALLEEAEAGGLPDDVLRLWEFDQPVVVVGRSSKVAVEVHHEVCRAEQVPVLRRASGGASIVAGPGCLMFSVVLSTVERPALRMIEQAHQFVMQRVLQAVRRSVPEARFQGTSDLTVGDRKFSGNSHRCKRHHLLYHGTLLYDFPLPLISRLLNVAPRQPTYRRGRGHADFVMNLPVEADALRDALREAWEATEPLDAWPRDRTGELAATRYTRDEWNLRL